MSPELLQRSYHVSSINVSFFVVVVVVVFLSCCCFFVCLFFLFFSSSFIDALLAELGYIS